MAANMDFLMSNLEWLEENTQMEVWVRSALFDDRYKIRELRMDLRFLQRFFWCAELFFYQDLPSEADENKGESLQSLLHSPGVIIHEAAKDLYSICQKIENGLEFRKFNDLFSSLLEMMRNLKPLMEPALEKYKHSSPSKHCTMEELMQFIESILEDMKKCDQQSLEPLQLKLEFLRNFVRFAQLRGIGQDNMNDILAHIEVVAINATLISCMSLVYGPWGEKYKSELEAQHSQMLQIQPEVSQTYLRVLKASSDSADKTRIDIYIVVDFIDSLLDNHWELLASNSSFTVSVMKILVEELRFWRNSLIYQREKFGDQLEEMTDIIATAASRAAIIICSLPPDEMNDDLTLEMDLELESIELVRERIAKICPEKSRSNFTIINELGFIDLLLQNLKELTDYKSDSIAFAQGQIDMVLEDLVFLRDFLQDIVDQRNKHEELEALWFRVVEVAYKIELVTDSLVVGDLRPARSPILFNTLKEEVKQIKIQVKEIYKENRYEIGVLKKAKRSIHLPSRSSKPAMYEVVVGFKDEAEKIIDRLEGGSSQLDIVSIVGMPGLGKTTLAKKVYNDPSIMCHFYVRAWCCVSQGYQKRNLLLDILNDVVGELPIQLNKMNDEDLADVLRKKLKGKRYLIVLDDLWDIEAWYDLQLSFPNDENGSRMLLTSRFRKVVPDSNPHFLRLLTDAESWELLQEKLFHNNDCPPGLCDVGVQVAKSCKGLPLSVVIVAGILGTMGQDSWEEFAKSLSTSSFSTAEQCMELLELSYKHLPDNLKPCLLYFASFLQDQEVSVSRLTWLWIAEGFVRKTTEESLENLAEDYLVDLIDRSLIIVAKQRSKGGTKAYRVHDLIHQFCAKKAREENFLQLLHGSEKLGPFIEPRRLCIYSERENFCKQRLFFRSLRSLLFFRISGDRSINQYDISSIFRNLKLLKVLDLGSIDLGRSFPSEIEMLVQLRYLALLGGIRSFPSTIVKLFNLETFLVKGTRGEIELPHSLMNMTQLRHVHVNDRAVFSLPEENLEKCPGLCNLDTFSTPFLSSGRDMVKIIRKLPNIRKLRCIFFGSWDSNEGYQFPALDFLSRLESLKVLSTGKVRYQLEFSFPSNLKKLTLSKFCLPWAEISRFSKLPNLEVLKLLTRACEGETWGMKEEEFQKLRFLKLENLNIVHWNACSDNFPCLRQLVLQRCRRLQRIPYGVAEVTSLEMIEVKWCRRSAASSAKEILEEEREGLKVSIYPPDWDNKSPEEGS